MATRLGIGIIGLGPRWRRYRRVLRQLHVRVQVRAVCDQMAYRAEREAKRHGCAAAAGPLDLCARADVEAVLLLDAQWYGLWPLGRAADAGKPVLCAVSPVHDEAHVDALRPRLRDRPVLMARAASVSPAVAGLAELVRDRLGAVGLVRADRELRAPRVPRAFPAAAVLSLMHTSSALLGGPPLSIGTTALDDSGLTSLTLEYAGGRAAQLTLWAGPAVRRRCRFEVVTAKGTATAELSRRLCWEDADGLHARRLSAPPAERVLLEHFLQAVQRGERPRPDFEEAYQALTWLRAARQSRIEGRRIVVDPPAGSSEASA